MTTAEATGSSIASDNPTKPNETITPPSEQAMPKSDAWSEANFQKTEKIEKLSFTENNHSAVADNIVEDNDGTIDAFNSMDNIFNESEMNLDAILPVTAAEDETLSLLRNNGDAVEEHEVEVFNVSDLANLARYRDVDNLNSTLNDDDDNSSNNSSDNDTVDEEEEDVVQCECGADEYTSLIDEEEASEADEQYLRSPQQTHEEIDNFGQQDTAIMMTTTALQFQTPIKQDRRSTIENDNQDDADADADADADSIMNTSLPFPTDKSISPINTSRSSTGLDVVHVHVNEEGEDCCTPLKFSPDFMAKMEQKMGRMSLGDATTELCIHVLGDNCDEVDDNGIPINSSLWNVSTDGIGISGLDSILEIDATYEATVAVRYEYVCMYHDPPQVRPSPYETTLWQSSDVLLHIVSYLKLEDIRNVMCVNAYTLRCLTSNGMLYQVMKHAVRRGKCFGGRVSRGVFWTALVDEVVRQDNEHVKADQHRKKYSKVATYPEMLKKGKNGKWTAIINRDVMRAFGTLPPHKTGARAKADSIVRYLTAFGRKNKSKSLDMSSNNLALSVPTDKIDMQYWLGNILYALSIQFSTVGYCQGMDYVVAHLMRTLKETMAEGEDMRWLEEATFHLTAKLFKNYNLQHMYWPELRCLKVCCRVLDKLMFIHLPVLADHLDHYDLNVGLFALGWFQTLFLYIPSMPSATVCHIWDIWIVERSFKIFFRVAIAILFLSQPTLLNLDAEGMMTYLNTFPDPTLLNKNILIPCALSYKVTNRMLTDIEQVIQKEQQQKEAGLPS